MTFLVGDFRSPTSENQPLPLPSSSSQFKSKDKDEVNKREILECDGRTHDPDTMVDPPTPKPIHKSQDLGRVPTTIVSCREEHT